MLAIELSIPLDTDVEASLLKHEKRFGNPQILQEW